nr:unnamed protein product [Digitaria exilis]
MGGDLRCRGKQWDTGEEDVLPEAHRPVPCRCAQRERRRRRLLPKPLSASSPPTAANPLSPQQHAQKKLGRQRTEASPMAPADGGGEQLHKAHRQHKSGAKARKKKGKGNGAAGDDAGGEQKNPKLPW